MTQSTNETKLAAMGLGSLTGDTATTESVSKASAAMIGLLPTATTTTPGKRKAAVATKAVEGDAGEAKRRGPNSHRVRDMFAAVGTERMPLDDLIDKYHVSVHVVRQSKRFDPHRDRGQVVIKTLPDEATGQKKTYIWRAPAVAK